MFEGRLVEGRPSQVGRVELAHETGLLMHELAIAESVVAAITARTGESSIAEVHLEIGRLSGVSSDSLRFCFELATAGTGVEGARLDIDEPGGFAHCSACDFEFPVDDLVLLCPCGSADVRVLRGEELRILSVEVSR
jgi:hydrogenase nickel incorporation protein HypA/HybF